MSIKVVKFVSYLESEEYKESPIGGLGGFFSNSMRWEDYLEASNEVYHSILEVLRKAIIENDIKCTGAFHQSSSVKSCPVFSDGTCATYSYRAWGDLMAAVWSSEDDKDYSYMDFYM